MPVNVGLIGLGRHGLRYANHLLEPIPGIRLVAVCRRDTARGSALAAERKLRFYRDPDELIADADVDAVVCVAPPSVAPLVCRSTVAMRKPLLIEKPLATRAAVAREMVETAETAGVPLMTAQTLRFDATIDAFKGALVDAGPLQYGVLTLRIEPRSSALTHDVGPLGMLLEIGVHLFDLIRYLTCAEVEEVQCHLEPSRPGSETKSFIRLRLAGNGLSFLLDLSRVSEVRAGRIEWVGQCGQIIGDWVQSTVTCQIAGSNPNTRRMASRPTIVETLRAFAEAIEEGRPMPISGWDGYEAVRIAEGCYEAAMTGRPLRLRRDQQHESKAKTPKEANELDAP